MAVGENSLRAGDYSKGYEILNSVAQANPDSTNAMLALGGTYFNEAAYLKARTYYLKASTLGAVREGQLGIARVSIAQRDLQGAQVTLVSVLKKWPGDPGALNMQGVIFDAKGAHQQAQSVYRQILASQPDNQKAMNNLALSLMLDGYFDAAYLVEAELYRSNRDDPRVRQNLSLLAYLNGDKPQARKLAAPDLSEPQVEHNFTIIDSLRK